MYFITRIIVLFLIFVFVCSYVVIGNYSQLNPKDCGISRVSTLVDTNCFEWHKGYDSSLKRGKFVGHSDAPWVALLRIKNNKWTIKCTGSVIADNWIITAAHCLENATNIKIYFGYNFTTWDTNNVPYYEAIMEEVYLHPKYADNPGGWGVKIYDLGLIKINQTINTSTGEHSICLPNKFVRPPHYHKPYYEYAMIAGWGPNRQNNYSEHKLRIVETNLEIYYRRDWLTTLQFHEIDNQGICQGDSGSPVWQYYMGRAVIVGVVSESNAKEDTNCEEDNVDENAAAAWVDSEIDWIINVTKLE